MSQYQYQIGGSLPLDAPTYITRKADQELYQSLKNGEFCYVLNSRHLGKTSLRIQTMHRLQEEGLKCVAIDLQAIGISDITSEEWYAGIIDSIVSSLELDHYFDFKSWWCEFQRLSNVHRLSKFFDEILLTLIPENIVIFIDEIETIFSLDFKVEDFFMVIRECFNKRTHSVNFQRLTFALFGVALPSDLIKDKKRTPFSIGKYINLTGFNLTEAYPLLEGLKDKSAHPERVLQSILFWTGGQPFLTQKLCNLVANFPLPIYSENTAEVLETIVRSQIIKNWQTQDEPEHLKVICDSLLFSEKTVGKLLGLYQQILEKGSVKIDQSFEQKELILSGLVVEENQQLIVYNPIYLAVFNPQWVKQELENLRPYSQGIIAWLASHRLDTSRLLRGQALQDALNWSKEKNLSYQDYQFLTASQEYDLEEARQILELKQKALESEQFKIEAKQNKRNLELLEKETKILKEMQEKSQKKIKIGKIALLVSVISAIPIGGLFLSGKQEKFLLKIDQSVTQAYQKFEFAQIDGLITAIEAGQDFQQIYHNDITFGKNPIHTPMFVLRPILDHIQEKNQLTSHQKGITSINFSPNGQYLASGSSDQMVKIWDLQNSQYINLSDHQDQVTAVEFSPDGQYLASASLDKTVKIWNLQGNLLKNITQYEAGVNALSFSPDGQYLATASLDNRINIWDLQGNLYQSFNAHEGRINALTFSPDSQYLATASSDTNAMIWDLQGKLKQTLKQDQAILALKFSPDGTKIVTVSTDNYIYIWDKKGKILNKIKGHKDLIRAISFHPDGTKFATVSDDLTTKIWDMKGNLLTNLKGHQQSVLTVAFSPDGETLATGSKDRSIRLWTLKQPESSLVFKGHENSLISGAFSPDGQTIATTSSDQTLRLWDLEGHQTLKMSHPQSVTSIAFTPDGQYFLSGCEDNILRLWNKEGQLLKELKGHNEGILNIKVSADGQRILTTSRDNTAILWDREGKIIHILTGHEGSVYSGDFSPNGDYIVTVSEDGTTRLWDQEGKFLKILTKINGSVKTINFNLNNKFIITGSSDGIIRLINLDGKIIKEIQAHYNPINQVRFSPDGEMIASASFDGLVRLWNLNGDILGELRGHQGEIFDVIFSPLDSEENPYILTTSRDKTARLWHLENLDQLLNRGCNWLDDYFLNHPEMLEKLKVCKK